MGGAVGRGEGQCIDGLEVAAQDLHRVVDAVGRLIVRGRAPYRPPRFPRTTLRRPPEARMLGAVGAVDPDAPGAGIAGVVELVIDLGAGDDGDDPRIWMG